ncbi:CdiA family toxin C-terminal domain-containing protein [Paenibacillus sp. FSL H8-0332]|uniref:CdiA family toxin C-terminal domain-containing protein n=1 Tax=Paenibacillus sp. FSL H8-0332 TaxID=2954742 RepID=UPI0030D104E1
MEDENKVSVNGPYFVVKVYQAFGIQAQMEAVHAQAAEARQKLASLGVAKIYYESGKDLSAHYRQPAVTACEYDPSITGDKVPLLHNEEYLLLLRLAMEKTAAGAFARGQLAAKRQEIQIAAALKQVQEQIEAQRRLNGPPLTLPDGTPITADNKENETTWDFYQAKVYVPNEYLTPMYTSYLGWLDETYGLTTVESRIRQSGDVVLAFTEGLVKEVVMGVADTATFAFKLVVDPVKTTAEIKQQAQYLIDHPEVLVEAAKMAYHQFDEGTPEEKAKMLGSVASILVPGLQVTKAGKVGKVLGEVEDVVSQAAKDALQGIKQKLPNLGPVVQTPEGFVFKIGEIPDTPALPKTPVQQRYMDGLEGGGGGIEGTGNVSKIPRTGTEWDEYFRSKYVDDNVTWLTKNKFEYVNGFDDHLINGQSIVRKGNKGVVGGHNLASFEKILTDQGWKLDDLIVSKTQHPKIPGVYQIQYRLPALDRELKVIPDQYKNIPHPKTVYDSTLISNDQIIQWGKEAMMNGEVVGREIRGTASNGLKFTGYLNENGKVTNFFPNLSE